MRVTRFAASFLVICSWFNAALAVTIPTVRIGNPGNPADLRYIDPYHPNGAGSVGYTFFMARTEVTNAQYVEFLNAVAATDPYSLYKPDMTTSTLGGIVRSGVLGSYTYSVKPDALGVLPGDGNYGYSDRPVTFTSWYDALRFTNWLHNGQISGGEDATTTEDGAYTFSGYDAVGPRNAGARWWLPNDDEWYKAAYHKNDGVTANYWDYPTSTDSRPNNNPPSLDTGNSANFWDNSYLSLGAFPTGNPGYPLTKVGAYALSQSPYGTYDQGGNVDEWTETLFYYDEIRLMRGGNYYGYDGFAVSLHASSWMTILPYIEAGGFRVATIPEPSAAALLSLAAVAGFIRRRH